jgi:hypothetical protein
LGINGGNGERSKAHAVFVITPAILSNHDSTDATTSEGTPKLYKNLMALIPGLMESKKS